MIAGTAICSMVLIGALMVGDSVKVTLKRLAQERIGQADIALLSPDGFFREALAVDLNRDDKSIVAPLVVTRGNVSFPDGTRIARNVQVLGVDERFWKLAPNPASAPDLTKEEFFVNDRLGIYLAAQQGDRLILRVEEPGLFSRDAPLSGERDNKFVSLNKKLGGVLETEAFGRFGLQGNQREPLTIFVPMEMLQKRMFRSFDEESGNTSFANFLLLGRPDGDPMQLNLAERALNEAWSLADAGISVKELRDTPAWSVRTRQVFLSESLRKAGEKAASQTTGVLTYLVNAISKGNPEANSSALVPYSMVSAVNPSKVNFLPDDLRDDEIVLGQWAADDLNASIGDTVALSYFAVGERRKLLEKKQTFRLRATTPLPLKVPEDQESDWTPLFPGLSDAESCGEWDTGIPIKHEVRTKDEDYWDDYRGSPKAFVSLAAGQAMWGNRWGSLTGLRVAKADASREKIIKTLRSELSAAEAGLLFRSLRQDASAAAESPIDFGQLFLGFSFFVIVAAMALTGMLFAFAMEQRNRQAGLLLALGIPRKKVRFLFLAEGFLLSLVGAGLGAWLATLYGQTTLRLLSGEWSGAVSGATFDFEANPVSVFGGLCSAVIIALLAMSWATRRQLRTEPRELLAMGETLASTAPRLVSAKIGTGKISFGFAVFLASAGILLALTTDLSGPGASMVFFGVGWCLLAAGLLFYRAKLSKAASESGALPDAGTLSRRNAARRSGRSLITAGSMAAGAFLVVGTGAFRKDSSSSSGTRDSGTGGFALVGESALPIYDDLNGIEGRELYDLNATLLDDVYVTPLRVREGDDASCLNLNKALIPRLFGVKPSEFSERFTFAEGNWSTLTKDFYADEPIPAVVDQNTMMWALKKGVGDLIEYQDGEGEVFNVRLSAVVKGSMLQGALYINEKHFEKKFPKQGGYRSFLVDSPLVKINEVTAHLSDKLANYGLEFRLAVDRLNELQEVENTYIAIFQALGGLGLLLGTAGLAVVVVRNLLERSKEFGLMEAVGYPMSTLRKLVMSEHRSIAFWGLGVGAIAAFVGIAPMLFSEAGQKPGADFAYLLAVLVALSVFWTWLAVSLSLRTSRLSTLRNE